MQAPEAVLSDYQFLDTIETIEDLMPSQPPKLHWTNWATFIIAIILLAGGIVWTVHYEIGRLDDRIATLDKHIGRVETAVRILGAKQGGDTKTLIDEALTVAKNASEAGHYDSAKAILNYANQLLETEFISASPAPQQFFDKALNNYQAMRQSPTLRDSAHEGTLKLAEYRTATIEKPANVPGSSYFYADEILQMGNYLYIKGGIFSGPTAFSTGSGRNTIDGMIIENTVFYNMTITYHGGPVILRNVRFINCHFEVPDSPRGDQLLVSAVDQPANSQIG